MTDMQLVVHHQLSRSQLVEALAVMTACTQDHAVIPKADLTGEYLISQLIRHVARFGVEGKPTYPRREHTAWAEDVAADLVAPLLVKPAGLLATPPDIDAAGQDAFRQALRVPVS